MKYLRYIKLCKGCAQFQPDVTRTPRNLHKRINNQNCVLLYCSKCRIRVYKDSF